MDASDNSRRYSDFPSGFTENYAGSSISFIFLLVTLQHFSDECNRLKTAYEIMPSLVGSEMCIRDSVSSARPTGKFPEKVENLKRWDRFPGRVPVSYTHLTLPTKRIV